MRKIWCILVAITILLCMSTGVFASSGSFEKKSNSQKVEAKNVKNENIKNNKVESQKTNSPEYTKKVFLVKPGMRGDDVRIVQNLLNNLGYPVGEVDGICGSMTVEAIKFFQKMNGLQEDGVVGEETLTFMNRAEPLASRNMRSMVMNATGYSAYDPGNGQYTANGTFLRKGLVAVDPNVIPLGSRLYIPGYGYAIADDTGGAIRGNKIDLAFDSHGEALQFGRRDVTVYIID